MATLQSAESLSLRRQVRLSSGHYNEPVDNPCQQAHSQSASYLQRTIPHQVSLSQTPDTPSANISPSNTSSSSSTSEHSQAFTSHFTSESSLVQKVPEEPQSPSAILTPSTDISPDADTHYSEDLISLKFDEEPWDIVSFDREFQSLNIEQYIKES